MKMTYRDTIIALNPLAYWRLGEQSGTAAVDEVGVSNGTYVGAPTKGVPGLVVNSGDTAVDFPGTDTDHITYAGSAQFGLHNQVTLTAWISTDTKAIPSGHRMYFNLPNATNYLSLNGNNIGNIFSSMSIGGVQKTLSSLIPAVIGQTYFVSVTYDGVTLRIYVDGVLRNSRTDVSGQVNMGSTGSGYIGRFSSAGYGWDGKVDEVAVFGSALSASEIANLYDVGNTPSLYYTVTFTPTDTRSTAANELTYTVRTATGTGGTLLTSGTATSGASKTTETIADDTLVDGSNTRYLRVVDGAGNVLESSFVVEASLIRTYDEAGVAHIIYVYQESVTGLVIDIPPDEAIVYVPILSDAALSQQEALGEAIIFQVTSGTDTVIFSDTGQIQGVNTYIIGDLTFHAQEVANFQTIRINEGGLIDFQMAEIYGAVDVPVLIEGLFGALYTDTGTEIPLAVFVNAESLATFHEQDAELPIYTYLDSVEQIELDESLDALIIEAIISGFDFDPGDSESAFILVIGHVQGIDDLNMVEPEDAYIAYTTSYAVDSMTWVDYAAEVMAETQVFGIDVQQMLENIAPVIIGTSLEGIDTRVWQEILEAAISRAIIESVDTSVYEDIKPYETGVFIGGTDTPAFTDTFGTVDIFTIITGTDRIPLRLYLRWDEQALMQMQLYTSDLLLDQPYQDLLVQSLVYESDVRTDMVYDSMLELRTVYTGAIDVL
jgi:hypothetical protein